MKIIYACTPCSCFILLILDMIRGILVKLSAKVKLMPSSSPIKPHWCPKHPAFCNTVIYETPRGLQISRVSIFSIRVHRAEEDNQNSSHGIENCHLQRYNPKKPALWHPIHVLMVEKRRTCTKRPDPRRHGGVSRRSEPRQSQCGSGEFLQI